MFGKDMSLRKKAMDAMMKEGPSLPMKAKKEPMMEEMEGGEEAAGYVQFMITPEEKQMILEMRKQKKSGGEMPEQAEEEMEY